MADKSSRITLGVALLTGVLAVAMSFVYLRGHQSGPSRSVQRDEPKVEVLRAREDLPADHKLDPGQDLESVSIPAETFKSFAQGAVKASDAYSLAGRRVYHPIAGGTVLQYGDLVPTKDLDIATGMVGMTIPVDESSLMGGLLVPGDFVDVVVTRPVAQSQGGMLPDTSAETGVGASAERMMQQVMQSMLSVTQETSAYKSTKVLSSIRVVSVGGRLARSREQLLFGPTPQFSSSGTVTLEVSSEEAIRLIEQKAGQGQVTLLLLPKQESGDQAGTIVED